PPAAPTSRNYAEMREKLRLRLTKRKEEQPKREEQQPAPERDGPGGGVEDHRRVEDLLQFINSADSKPASSSKAAKRARHKQKMEEKARQEAEAQQEEQRRRQEEEEAALQRELLRLQEHCSAKKKRKDKAKENTAPTPNNNNPQPLKQTAQNVLDHLSNGKSQLLQSLICPKDLRTESRANSQHGERGFSHLHNHNADVKVKAKPAAKLVPCEHAPIKKDPEANGGVTPAETKATRTRPVEAPAPPSEPRGNNRSASGKRQLKEDHRRSPPASNPSPSPPLHLQPHLPPPSQSEHTEQNGKPPSAESPQPKGKAKKNKKKKGDKINTSIDVFLPKDIDLDSTEMDETEREVEYFKFCLDSARQTRQRLSINWSNFSLKKATFAAH
uniref:FAM193 C-terminal domain-containing protein n=1 Tax=Hippocampus comes TaxID=109280 RepID=A0A3Q2Z4L1_HIPCM